MVNWPKSAKVDWCIALSIILPDSLAIIIVARFAFGEVLPRYEVDYRLVLLFVVLAHPSNFFIRWALNKDEFTFTAQASLSIMQMLSLSKSAFTLETAATTISASPRMDTNDQRLKVGRRIGTLERWLILLLVVSGNISSLGLVITAKSIVRYPQLNDKEFAEYYLLGTLLSVVLALVSGFLVLGGI